MKISSYLRTENIFLDVLLPDKDAALRFVADACVKNSIVEDGGALYAGLQEREMTLSTGVGGGIGFPHTASEEANDAAVLLIRHKKPLDFEAIDNLPVYIIIAIIVPSNKTTLHIRILARVSRLCKNQDFLTIVRETKHPEKLHEEIVKLEQIVDLL
jgi:PTS system nitrogen regulatory IIA component